MVLVERLQILNKLRDFDALGVHHTVEAEVQVWLVELEQFPQERFQLLKPLAHADPSLPTMFMPGQVPVRTITLPPRPPFA